MRQWIRNWKATIRVWRHPHFKEQRDWYLAAIRDGSIFKGLTPAEAQSARAGFVAMYGESNVGVLSETTEEP